MITCPKCSKENQDHYKFCLGCGAELPRDAGVKAFSAETPPHGVRAASGGGQAPAAAAGSAAAMMAPARASAGMGATVAVSPLQAAQMSPMPPQIAAMEPQLSPLPPQVAAAPPEPAAAPAHASPAIDGGASAPAAPAGAAAGAACPQCSHVNAASNKFCASCGYNLSLAAAPPPQQAAAPVAQAAPQVVLTALRADGTEAGTFPVPSPSITIGRDAGGIFAGDSYLSPRHASLTSRAGRVFVKDELSLNGVYLKLAPQVPVELRSGDVFRIGQEIIRFEALQPQTPSPDGVERLGSPARGYIGRIALVTGRDTTGNAFPVPEHGLSIGRERGDILFPEDGYVSGLHCQLTWENGKTFLTDVGSSNGTFVRVQSEFELHPQDILLMGQQLFRIAF